MLLLFWALVPDGAAREIISCTFLILSAHILKTWSFTTDFKNGVVTGVELLAQGKGRRGSLTHLPTLLEFASYLHFGGTALTSTFFEFGRYKEWLEGTGKYAAMPRSSVGKYNQTKTALTRAAHGFLCLFLYTLAEYYLEFDDGMLGSEAFLTFGDDSWVPFWKRIGIF